MSKVDRIWSPKQQEKSVWEALEMNLMILILWKRGIDLNKRETWVLKESNKKPRQWLLIDHLIMSSCLLCMPQSTWEHLCNQTQMIQDTQVDYRIQVIMVNLWGLAIIIMESQGQTLIDFWSQVEVAIPMYRVIANHPLRMVTWGTQVLLAAIMMDVIVWLMHLKLPKLREIFKTRWEGEKMKKNFSIKINTSGLHHQIKKDLSTGITMKHGVMTSTPKKQNNNLKENISPVSWKKM